MPGRYTKLGSPRLDEARLKAIEAQRGRIPSEHTLDFMRDLRGNGTSFRRIAEELNRRDIRTGHGNRWHAFSV